MSRLQYQPVDPDRLMSARILVCGSRDWGVMPMRCVGLEQQADYERELLGHVLEAHYTRGDVILHGGAPGADRTARFWAEAYNATVISYPADWANLGKAAGPVRNQLMVDQGLSFCLAFVNKPLEKSRGTADMVRRCRAANVPVVVTMVLR